MDFKRLAEVELLDSAPEGATAFAEVNGEVKRVAGGIGGGGSAGYVWDVTDRLTALFLGDFSGGYIDEDNQTAVVYLTDEEGAQIRQNSSKAGGLVAYSEGASIGLPNSRLIVSGTSFICLEDAVLALNPLPISSQSLIQVAVMYIEEQCVGIINLQAFFMLEEL